MWLHKEAYFTSTLARLESEGFAVKEFKIEGESCWLIFPPHSGIEWNEDNLIYRSSIWNSQGYPISLSWKKFFNWEERCDIAPKPTDLNDCELIDKIDGSTLLASMYKGHLILRTRGSTDVSTLDNGFERDEIIRKYEEFFEKFTQLHNTDCTFVFEWTTPTNKIVLDYGDELKLHLTGIINHADYSYTPQVILDQCSEFFGFERPRTYRFETFGQLQEAMKDMKGIEGVCVYFNRGQDIKKVKTDEYLMLHSVKFKLGYKSLVQMVYEEGVGIEEFKKRIVDRFDHEGLTYVEGLIDRIFETGEWLKDEIQFHFETAMSNVETEEGSVVSKKDFAKIVMTDHHSHYAVFLFKMFDAKLTDVRKLLVEQPALCEKFKKLLMEELKDE